MITTGAIAEGATLRLNVVYGNPPPQLSNPKLTGQEGPNPPHQPPQTGDWPLGSPSNPVQQPDGTYLVRYTTTPMLFNFHNFTWTLNGQVDYYIPPMMGQPAQSGTAVAAPITVTFKSMVLTTIPIVTQSGLQYCLLGTGNVQDRTITYGIDHAIPGGQTSVAGQADVRIYDIGGALRREVINAHNVPGTYTWTWDGNDNNGVALPNGVYPINVVVSHPGSPPTYTYGETSDTLTISNVSVACDGDATSYVSVTVSFTLTDSTISPPQNVHVKTYDPQLTLINDYTVPTPVFLGTNSATFLINNISFQGKEGTWTFLVTATDTRSAADKGHNNKPALERGTTFYAKLLSNPHYSQLVWVCNAGKTDNLWCGQSCARMWVDYKKGSGSAPTQDVMTRDYVVAQWDNIPPDPHDTHIPRWPDPTPYFHRALYPSEMGRTTGYSDGNSAVLNHYMGASVTKYMRQWASSQDYLIGQEVYYLAQQDEPSAAVVEMSYPNFPADPKQQLWHWMLIDGCVTASKPTGFAGTAVYGLFVDDPGSWFLAKPAYVSSGIWKQKYFWQQYPWDKDGQVGFMDAEDPPGEAPQQIAPAICEPPTKPHGKPISEADVNAIAHEGVSKHLLHLVGGFSAHLRGSQQGKPVLVKALDGTDSYYVTPYLRGGIVVGAVIVEADIGEFHGAGVSDAGWQQYPLISSQNAESIVHSATGKTIATSDLVWQFCNESKSRYEPFWKVTASDGTVCYVTQDGKAHDKLTPHSCVGR